MMKCIKLENGNHDWINILIFMTRLIALAEIMLQIIQILTGYPFVKHQGRAHTVIWPIITTFSFTSLKSLSESRIHWMHTSMYLCICKEIYTAGFCFLIFSLFCFIFWCFSSSSFFILLGLHKPTPNYSWPKDLAIKLKINSVNIIYS